MTEPAESAPPPQAPPPAIQMLQMINGARLSAMLSAAARFGLADQLRDGPRSCADLAAAVDADEPSLFRLLRGLASLGVFREGEPRVFGLTPLAELLRSDHPASLRAMATMYCDEWHWRLWSGFFEAVRTGNSAAERVLGSDAFAYLAAHPDQEQTFDQAMSNLSAPYNPAVAAACDCTGLTTLVDLGGGEGSLLLALLRANPSLRGVLYDRPAVIERARARLADAGLATRCETVVGDFFESIPAGGDAYLLKNVLHDWSDDSAIDLLRRCRAVMSPSARLWIVEMVIPPGNHPFLGKLLDMHMLLLGGRNRTETEFRSLLETAGFRLSRITPTAAPVSVIEALPGQPTSGPV